MVESFTCFYVRVRKMAAARIVHCFDASKRVNTAGFRETCQITRCSKQFLVLS